LGALFFQFLFQPFIVRELDQKEHRNPLERPCSYKQTLSERSIKKEQ